MVTPGPNDFCFVMAVSMMVLGITFTVLGLVIGNSYKHLVHINQTFFFWLGRERIVFNLGHFFVAIGSVLLAIAVFYALTRFVTRFVI